MITIAIQGIAGSFHHQAATKKFTDVSPVECTTFHEVFDKVAAGEVDCGVVAIENSIHGSISPVYRLLQRTDTWIGGETTLSIDQYLIGPEEVSVEDLNNPTAEVRTMFPAFAQCELWLHKHLPHPQRTEVYDTAYATKQVVEEGNPQVVSISGKLGAEIYGGKIIAGPINDDPHNNTRFVFLYKNRQTTTDADRTMLILQTDHEAGALCSALGIFTTHGINLSKLDSHPIPGDTRHYSFYVDCDAGVDDPRMIETLSQVQAQGCVVRILGSYRA